MDKTSRFLEKFRVAELIYITLLFLGGLFFIMNENRHQAQRTDKLYEMFIDLLKERK